MATVADIFESKINPLGSDVIKIPGDTVAHKAGRVMARGNIGAVVVEHKNNIVGIVSERDYVRKITLKGLHSKSLVVTDIMTAQVATVNMETALDDVVRLMLDKNIRHLPVVSGELGDRAENLVDVISIRDVMREVRRLMLSLSGSASRKWQEDASKQTVQDMLKVKAAHHGGKMPGVIESRVDQTVYSCLELMEKHHIGALVIEEDRVTSGIFTERDYMRKIIAPDRNSKETAVGDIMTPFPVCVTTNFSVAQCLQLVTERSFRHLPVMGFLGSAHDDDSRVVNVLSIKDILRTISGL